MHIINKDTKQKAGIIATQAENIHCATIGAAFVIEVQCVQSVRNFGYPQNTGSETQQTESE